MICKNVFVILLLLCKTISLLCESLDNLQLNNLRYNDCGRYSCPDNGKFLFVPDIMYQYWYTLSINSTFDEMNVMNSKLMLEFKVEIRIENCEGVMRVDRRRPKEGFSIFEETSVDKIYEDVHANLLRFSFYDGSIINVCPNTEESISSLNIKKGILSAFQNKMKRFDIDKFILEKDINGLCPTNYNLERINGTTLVIRKIKDLTNCFERNQLHSIIPTSRYVFQSKFYKWAPLKSSVICHQTIDHSILIHIVCHEEHTLKINSNQTYNSKTFVMQEFELVSETPSYANFFTFLTYPDDISIRDELSFNHKKPKKSEISELEESEMWLQQLCDITSEEFQLDAAGIFTKFIHTARHLSYNALEMLLEKSSDLCSTGRKHMQDSLPFLRSTAAISLMKEIIIKGNISESTANGWLFAISLFARPDTEVINSLVPLLEEENANTNILLSITSVIHTYNLWATETEDKEIILNTITMIENKLNKTLIDNHNQEKAIILLKSLGNAGILTSTIGYTLSTFIHNSFLSTETRITAIEAHRRLPCDFNSEALLDAYTDIEYEAEVRIAAYLQLMKCPTYGTIKKIKYTLENETVNQVGTFVWSHLQNILKSSLQHRIEIQSMLQDYNLQKKFKTDFRKFSRNYETSFSLSGYGVGGVIIGNIIFSTKSFIPTHLTLNVTINVYGEIINIIEIDVFLQGFEKYVENFFRNGTEYFIDKIEKEVPFLRFLRTIPIKIKDKIKSISDNFVNRFPEPLLSIGIKLFGNELKYYSYRGENGINQLINNFNIKNMILEFLNGQEIKFDYSTVFMDISYVSPTGAGVPLNLDVVGIAITNFDTSIFIDISNFTTAHQMLINGTLKPKFSVNFEGTMGTDLVYEQTQIKMKSKIYTSSEVGGNLTLNGYDDILLSLNLPLQKFDIFSFESNLYYKNNDEHMDVMFLENSELSNQPTCFWPLLDQILGLKICSTYYVENSTMVLQSLVDIFREPFKFNLFLEKSDPSATAYIFKYYKKFLKINESELSLEFETPGSEIPRDLKTILYITPENSNLTIILHANRTELQAHGICRNTEKNKILNLNLDINRTRHVDLILELNITQEKRMIIYTPKLYFAVTLKPVAELSGTYKWMEKKGISQCDIDLQFKTNKFDSNITGYILISDHSISSNVHIRYKFEKSKNESLNFEFKYNDRSNKFITALLGNFQLESTSYPEINLAISTKYQISHDRIDAKLEFIADPFQEDDNMKLSVQSVFSYYKSFNGLKLNTFLEIRKPITDLNFKIGLSHQKIPTSSNSMALVRYAKDKEIVVKFDTSTPQGPRFHCDLKLNVTLPAAPQSMIAHVRITEKYEHEYDLDFSGTWFSGHTAMAEGLFQDKSNHYSTNYIIKLLVRCRLFSEVLLTIKTSLSDQEHKVTISMDYEKIKYGFLLRHVANNPELHETYIEYTYNNSALYYVNNCLDIKKKEIILEIHLDKIRDIHMALKSTLQRWNSDVGMELKWDVNRDPSQKLMFNFNTKNAVFSDRSQYTAKFMFEYPGHISVASFLIYYQGNYRSLSIALETNPTSIIELMAYSETELLTKGFIRVGFKLLTPFENWRESAFYYGLYSGKQNFQTNGSLSWQDNQNIIFDAHGGYSFDDNKSSLTLSSSLNSTMQDLAALAFAVNYTRVENEIHTSFLLQPNLKYSLFVLTSGLIKYYDNKATEYIFLLHTRTPFLDYVETKFSSRLKVMTENRLNGDVTVLLNNNLYTLHLNGIMNLFEETKLCLRATTPYETYRNINGLFFYDPKKKNLFVNLTSEHLNIKTDIIYVYNNLSNFHLKLEIVTPLSYLRNMNLIGMYKGKAIEIRLGWNTFNVGFAAVTNFNQWTDLEYSITLYTPIEAFKQSSVTFKIFIESDKKIVTARVKLSNITKVGINFEYDSQKSEIMYLDECDRYYDKDTSGIFKTIVLHNGLLELDTLIYPTIQGMYYLHANDNRYTIEAKAAIFFLKFNLWDQIDYENNTSFNNTFKFTSSIDMFSKIITYTMVKKVNERITNTSISTELTSFNQKHKGNVDVYYEYKLIDGSFKQIKSKIDGIHNIVLKINTPFEMLEKGEIFLVTQIQNYVFETVANMITDHTNISLIANLQYAENYFDLSSSFNMSSNYIMVPSFKIHISRDFSRLEKQIIISLKEPANNLIDFTDLFSLRCMWYIDNRNYITLAGELRSPFKILDELKGSLYYSHEIETEMYYLEAYMKYSNKTEMKARANLKPPNITLNLESSMEGLRNAHFVGTLEKIAAGQQKIDAVMITNSNFKIQGSSSVTDLTPFAIKGKLLKGKDGIEISSVEMHVKKKTGGYNILAALYSKGKTLNVETEITDYSNNSRVINLAIKTGKGTTESLQVNAELKLEYPGIYILTIKGDSTLDNVKGSSISKIEVWFRNGIGALFVSLDSVTIKGKGEIFTIWKPPNHIYGESKVQLLLDKKITDIFSAKIYFIKMMESFDNFTTGLLIDLNNKWKMEANVTTTMNSINDRKLSSYLVLPNYDTYSITSGLKYSEKYDEIQHLIVYSRPKDTPCYTISDINIAVKNIKGLFAFKCGIKDSLFMVNTFKGIKTSNMLTVQNFLKSNTLANILTTNLNYKSENSQIIHVKFFYPPTKLIAFADVNFQSTDNFDCFINTTTPFSHMPYFACDVKSKTDSNLYERYGKIYLQERPALINITHVKVNKTNNIILNDGWIVVAFPVATWHEGMLTYTYENKSENIVGSTNIIYNHERIINGTFTRNITKTVSYDKYFTNLAIGNNLIPVGINYIRQINNQNSDNTIYDLKRIELYKLLNASAFNVTGEMLVENINFQEWITFRVLNFNRSIILKSRVDSGNPCENSIFLKLKPELWFHYILKTNLTVNQNSEYQKQFDVYLAYPRRNFSVGGDFIYGDHYLTSQIVIRNFMSKPNKAVGLVFHSKKPFPYLRETSVILFHPSLAKNVTVFSSFYSAKNILVDVTLVAEYSTDIKRKLEFSCIIEDRSKRGIRNYTLRVNSRHPATKFKLDVFGAFKSETGIHFIGNNISYQRSYVPDQFWNGRAFLNTKENKIEVERISTRTLLQIHGDYKTQDSKHILNTLIVEGFSTNISGNFEIDLFNKIVEAFINLTADSTDRLQIEGNIKENREGKFNIWRTYNNFHFPQMMFYLALNHSKLLSSALMWRTDIGTNIIKIIRSTISYVWVSAQESIEFWTQFLRSEFTETSTAVWNDAKLELIEFLDDVSNIKTIQDNINLFKTILNDSYNANEFFLRDIHEFYILLTHEISFVDKIESLPKIVGEVVDSMGETGLVIKNSLIWVVNTIKELYDELLTLLDDLVVGKAEIYITKFIKKGTEKFDNFIKDLHISFISSTESAIQEMLSVLSHYREKILTIFEPTFIEIVHHIDTTLWTSTKKLVDFVYAKKDDLMNSPYFLRSANFTQRLDAIYKDFSKNDAITNVRKYVGLLFNAVYEYYVSQIPYREEIVSIGSEIMDEIKALYKLPLISYTVDNIQLMYNQIVWLYNYFEMSSKIQKIIPFLYRSYQDNSYTAIELEMKNRKPKTKLLFAPEHGIIKFEQKLPVPWHAFNETPLYEELEEYKNIRYIQSFVSTVKLKIWSFYNEAVSFIDPKSWFPPFENYAQLIGFSNFITFDKVYVPFHGNFCKYLLSHDFMEDEFSLVLNSDDTNAEDQRSISLLISGEEITVQFTPLKISINSRKTLKFPLQLNNTSIYFDNSIITIKNQNGVTLKCNMYHQVCTVHLSGWFFGKVSGLLGTMNNEQYDDVFVHTDKYNFQKKEYYLWSLSQERDTCPAITTVSMVPFDNGANEKCGQLFLNMTSTFESCFTEVNPSPYYDICITNLSDEHVCSTAIAYVESCTKNSVPLRIPAFCVKCIVNNEQYVEGSFISLEDESIPKSSDIIFIVEAKKCNKDLLIKKNILQLINNLTKEFTNNKYVDIRYSLVVFGGEGVYEEPHSVTFNGDVFSNSSLFPKYFENFSIGNGNSDIFGALRFAAKLSLRAGVSKTFILIPCSSCDPRNMSLDYSVLHHAMIEKSIILHILMNEEFLTDKSKSGKVLFGLDSNAAYTKEDFKHLKGDIELRKQTKLTKSLLGYCTPLALESNGTLFTAKILTRSNTATMKFISTFSKRVILTAKPEICQKCECHSDENGVPYVECISCLYPSPMNFDFSIEEENDFSAVLNLESHTTNNSQS